MLNLSQSVKIPSYIKLIDYKSFIFPGGEEHIVIKDTAATHDLDKIKIISSVKSSSDVLRTILATDAIRNVNRDAKISLYMPYFPYARQDRMMVHGEPFSLKVMCNLINSQGYYDVTVFDPHSDVTPALLNNVRVVSNVWFGEKVWNKIHDKNSLNNLNASTTCLVSPDAGAEKKIYKLASRLNLSNDQLILGSKQRDVSTGKILRTDFRGDVKGKNCLIVDDIADGGWTFINLAKLLKEAGAEKVYLAVSHGIFSNGFNQLKESVDKIYTTDSVYREDTEYKENTNGYIDVTRILEC